MTKKIYRAGIIPYYYDDNNVLNMMFMLPSDPMYGGDKYQVAKGKLEEGESDIDAAYREAREELGLFRGNCRRVDCIGNFLGRTMIYVTEVDDPNFFGDPHFETKSTKWMTATEFQDNGRSLHKAIVGAAVRQIEEVTKND